MTRALVVHCHPCAESFVDAVCARVLVGLRRGSAEVRVNDLYADGFDPVFTEREWAHHLDPGPDPTVRQYTDDLAWAEVLVLVYPTWWSGQPAMLKGWIDRVWVSGVAWDLPEGANRLRPGLRGLRRIVAVTTHGSSKLVNALEGEAGKRTVTRGLRLMCHPRTRTTWLAFYGTDTSTDDERRAFLDRVERRLARLAR